MATVVKSYLLHAEQIYDFWKKIPIFSKEIFPSRLRKYDIFRLINAIWITLQVFPIFCGSDVNGLGKNKTKNANHVEPFKGPSLWGSLEDSCLN